MSNPEAVTASGETWAQALITKILANLTIRLEDLDLSVTRIFIHHNFVVVVAEEAKRKKGKKKKKSVTSSSPQKLPKISFFFFLLILFFFCKYHDLDEDVSCSVKFSSFVIRSSDSKWDPQFMVKCLFFLDCFVISPLFFFCSLCVCVCLESKSQKQKKMAHKKKKKTKTSKSEEN